MNVPRSSERVDLREMLLSVRHCRQYLLLAFVGPEPLQRE